MVFTPLCLPATNMLRCGMDEKPHGPQVAMRQAHSFIILRQAARAARNSDRPGVFAAVAPCETPR